MYSNIIISNYNVIYWQFNIHASISINVLKANIHGLLDFMLHICQFSCFYGIKCLKVCQMSVIFLLWRSCEAAGIDQSLSLLCFYWGLWLNGWDRSLCGVKSGKWPAGMWQRSFEWIISTSESSLPPINLHR